MVKNYIQMCGDWHLSKLSMAGNIIHPTLMTVVIILTYTYFTQKTKTSMLTRITRWNSRLSMELASKGFVVIMEMNTYPFNKHLAKSGTLQSLTVHDMPKYNGVSEWLNHTLLEKV